MGLRRPYVILAVERLRRPRGQGGVDLGILPAPTVTTAVEELSPAEVARHRDADRVVARRCFRCG